MVGCASLPVWLRRRHSVKSVGHRFATLEAIPGRRQTTNTGSFDPTNQRLPFAFFSAARNSYMVRSRYDSEQQDPGLKLLTYVMCAMPVRSGKIRIPSCQSTEGS
jgi:hypothetical protein